MLFLPGQLLAYFNENFPQSVEFPREASHKLQFEIIKILGLKKFISEYWNLLYCMVNQKLQLSQKGMMVERTFVGFHSNAAE